MINTEVRTVFPEWGGMHRNGKESTVGFRSNDHL